MAKYGFFNSRNGDRTYDADDLSNFFLRLINDGVLAAETSSALKVVPASGMTAAVNPGWAFIKAKYYYREDTLTVPFEAASATLDRIDRVVVRLNKSIRTVEIKVLTGTPAAEPTAPAMQRTEYIYDICLATVSIPAGTTDIVAANITDTRSDNSVCGFVTGFSNLGGLSFCRCSQAEYDAMESHDPNTLYVIVEGS